MDDDEYTDDETLWIMDPLEWIQVMRERGWTEMTDEELLLMRLREREDRLKKIRDIIKAWRRHYYPFNTWHHGQLMDGYRVVLDNLDLPHPEV